MRAVVRPGQSLRLGQGRGGCLVQVRVRFPLASALQHELLEMREKSLSKMCPLHRAPQLPSPESTDAECMSSFIVR